MTNQARLFEQLIEKAKTNKSYFRALKNVVVKCQEFELAAELREIERNSFPETEEEKNAKAQSAEYNTLFRMIDLNVSDSLCWLIPEAIKMHKKKRGKFSVRDAAQLIGKTKQIFGSETP